MSDRPLRVAIVTNDYPAFTAWLYGSRPGLADCSYAEQIEARHRSLFGYADFFSRNLRREGFEAWELYANNLALQSRWATEHPDLITPALHARIRIQLRLERIRPRILARVALRAFGDRWWQAIHGVLEAQFRWLSPDIVLNQDMMLLKGQQLREIAPPGGLLVGETDAAFRPDPAEDYGVYDWMRCSLEAHRPHFPRSSHYRFGFEASILESVPAQPRNLGVTFVGSLSGLHSRRAELLETIAARTRFSWWGPGPGDLPRDSALRRCYQGQAWGREMFEVLARSAIVVNRQIDWAAGEADNMRLFETTGMGALLVTDAASGLGKQFVEGQEVVTYQTPEECVQQVIALLADEPRRARIAAAGQARTLRDHTYAVRMKELAVLLRQLMAEKTPAARGG